jgi:SPP1 gp7 family putative phage head morphogenesis protein
MLRRAFMADMKRRFAKLRREVVKFFMETDALGMKERKPLVFMAQPQPREHQFLTDAAKLTAFNNWLKQQIEIGVFSVAPGTPLGQPWTATYIESAYKRGQINAFMASRAGSLAEQAGIGEQSLEVFLRTAFGQPEMMSKVQLLATRAFEQLKGVTASMAADMNRILAQGMIDGRGVLPIAREMARTIDGLTFKRALMIARSELISAHAEGQLDSFVRLGVEELGLRAELSTVGDDRVCDICAPLDGKIYTIEEARGVIPLHVNCLPGDSLILARDRITAATKRRYDGDVIVLKTARNRELICTPNHPILCDGRWVAACTLQKGSHVICDGSVEWESSFHNYDNKKAPARIQDVVEAFAESCKVASREVPMSAPDFHGDGTEGQVAVIWTDGHLGGSFYPSFKQHALQFGFQGGNQAFRILLFCLSRFAKSFNWDFFSKGGSVGVFDLVRTLFRRHLRPSQCFSLAGISGSDARFCESIHNCGSGNSMLVSDSQTRHSRNVVRHGIRGTDFSGTPNGSVFRTKVTNNHLASDTILAGKLSSGDSGPVFLDQIVSVGVVSFHGHVFNLETETGYYMAQGIASHNCRCSWMPYIEQSKKSIRKI